MYIHYYKLESNPFQISPDPRFLWIGSERREAFAKLENAILQSRGFVIITGEPGTGKSAVLNATIDNLKNRVRFPRIIDPALSEMDFFNSIASAMEMGRNFQSKEEFLFELEYLLNQPDSMRIVFVIDEAQRLSIDLLDLLDGFFKAATMGATLGCTFAGQPVFLDTLSNNRALRRRIVYTHTIEPFTLSETGEYIAHRIKVAGREMTIFTPEAVQEIFNLSKGNPRLINTVCERALLNGYAVQEQLIGPELIIQSMEEMNRSTTATEPELHEDGVGPVKKSAPVETTSSSANGALSMRQPSEKAGRRKGYALIIAVFFVVGALLLLMMKNGTRVAGTFSPSMNVETQRKPRPVEPTPSVEEVHRLQEQILGLRRDRDKALERLNALQAKFDQLAIELRELRAIKDRTKGLERAIAWKDAAISQLRRRLEHSEPNQTDDLIREIETLKKVNSRLQERLDELNR